MPEDGGLSIQDVLDLREIRNKLPKGDARVEGIDNLIKANAPTSKPIPRPRKQGPVTAREAITSPGATLSRRSGELAQTAQSEMNKAFGPESQGKNILERGGHAALSFVPAAASVVDKIGAGIYGMANPKDATIIASGAIDPAIPASYYGTKAIGSLTGMGGEKSSAKAAIKERSPEAVEKALLDLSQVAASGSAAGAKGSGTAASALKEPIGKAARRYAERVSTEMTKQIPEKKTGINEPARVAEATREITTLKKASDKYESQAMDATRKIESKAVEAKNNGVYIPQQQTNVVYDFMDRLYKRSGTLKQMKDFGQLKSKLWDPLQRTPYIDPVQVLELRRDLDEMVKYDSKGAKNQQTPAGKLSHDMRTVMDQYLDQRVPGWQDLNEKSSTLIKSSERLQERYDSSFFNKIRASFSDVLAHPISTIGPGYMAFEVMKAAGTPHYMQYIGAVAASGVAHYLYDSLPSQTARIAMADALADAMIGPRSAKGPKSYAPVNPMGLPGQAGGGPQGPFAGPGGNTPPIAPAGLPPQGPAGLNPNQQNPMGLVGAQPKGPLALPPQGSHQLPPSSANIPPEAAATQVANQAAVDAFKKAAAAAGMKPQEIESLVVQAQTKQQSAQPEMIMSDSEAKKIWESSPSTRGTKFEDVFRGEEGKLAVSRFYSALERLKSSASIDDMKKSLTGAENSLKNAKTPDEREYFKNLVLQIRQDIKNRSSIEQ